MSDTKSSFYANGNQTATGVAVANDTPAPTGSSAAPSSFYKSGPSAVGNDPAAASAYAVQAANSATAAANSATAAANSLNAINVSGGTITPIVDGAAAVGTSTKWAHEDHVHPADTATADARIANAAGTVTPAMDGTAAKGTSTKWAHEDHVHPTDTTRAAASALASYAPLASPALTGTPTAPTPTAGDNSTNIATTAFVTSALTPLRRALTANTTYYVDTALGNDANSGLSSGAGAFKTIAKALSVVGAIDCATFQLTVSVAAGSYAEDVALPRMVYGGPIPLFIGAGSTTIITGAAAGGTGRTLFSVDGGAFWQVQNFKLAPTTSTNYSFGLGVTNGSVVKMQGVEFGAMASVYQFYADKISGVFVTGPYTVSGGGTTHFLASGLVKCRSQTITVTGTPAFAQAFAYAANGYLDCFGSTFSGAATGPRYLADTWGYIFTAGGGANFFPGSTAGSTTAQGLYA